VNQAMSLLTSQATVEWYTPPAITERARTALGGIDLDPASNTTAQAWIRATTYYTADDLMSGLARPWFGRVWLNPPFDDTPAWALRIRRAWLTGEISAGILLVNSAPGYAWWEELWRATPVVLLRERLRFVREDGAPGGQAKKGQTVAYFGADVTRFAEAFDDLGRLVLP
jgi:hypothetical protein